MLNREGKMVFGVEDFDMANYPEVDEAGKILFSVWRFDFEGPNGQLFWKHIPDKSDPHRGEMIPHSTMVSSVHRSAQRWTEPKPEDIIRVEREIAKRGGKVLACKIGLWFYQRDQNDVQGGHWEETPYQMSPSPQHWLNVTDQFYKEWRPKAYEGREEMDPWGKKASTRGISASELPTKLKEMQARKDDYDKALKRAAESGKELEELRKAFADMSILVKKLQEDKVGKSEDSK